MGKSEINRLRPSQLGLHTRNKNPVSFYIPEPAKDEDNNRKDKMEIVLCDEIVALDNQVAGHTNDGRNIGMLKYKGYILKPAIKKARSDRETNFYEQLRATHDPYLKELIEFVPKYYGSASMRIDNKSVDCLVLEDLTKGFKEPCIIDIKIGKRTWDPLASYDKIMKEDEKYHDSKRDLGFCIPGFQVYKVTNGKLRKFGKEYGKKLNKETIPDALKLFLNADTAWSRSLLVQLLVNLWKIQKWSRKQNSVRIYSSSILLIYDARRLRQDLEIPVEISPQSKQIKRSTSLYRPLSLAILDKESVKTGFSGQLSEEGPIFDNNTTPRVLESSPGLPKKLKPRVPTLKRMHSLQNNYDEDLEKIRNNYVYMLEDLVTDEKKELWATAKMIDFAHAYPSENNNVDCNYLDGIENLVKIFEEFLLESNS